MDRQFTGSRTGRMLWKIFDKVPLFDYLALFIVKRAERRRILFYMKNPMMHIHPTVSLGDVWLRGNVEIGEGTYYNRGQIFTGPNSCVKIGKFCAIGYNVNIKSQSHDLAQPTALDHDTPIKHVEASISIGDHVWIGDNVFIRHGVSIGDHAIIGANSVVLKDIPAYALAAGTPAKVIRSIEAQENEK